MSQMKDMAFHGVLQNQLKILFQLWTPVWQLESHVELLGAADQKVKVHELLCLLMTIQGHAQIGGTICHGACREKNPD